MAKAGNKVLLFLFLCMFASEATPQDSPAKVEIALGFGVDTLASPDREIMDLWRRYLSGPPRCDQSTPLWSASERARWTQPDLLCPFVYQGFTKYTVVQLAPAAGLDSTYVIRTLVSTVTEPDQNVKPLALYRVYAVREDGRWVLANALPRLTRAWSREKIGQVTFVFPPEHRFDRLRANATAAFVDSLARAFGLPPLASLDYYFTNDLGETMRAAGLEFFPLGPDTVGGRSEPANHLVLVGSSRNAEAYRHEISHVVLAPFLAPYRPARLVAEGLMTWTGGSAGFAFEELMPDLARYLDAHPEIILETVLSNPPPRLGSLDVGYSGLAVLCEMVYEKDGLRGLRRLAESGQEPANVLKTAASILNVKTSRLGTLWRKRVHVLAGSH